GRPSGSTRLSRRKWPSTAHIRPVLSVTIGAITTVVFEPCAISRIRSCGGSQSTDLDAEADGGVDVGTLVRLGVGFDVAECTRDVHDVLRLLKASKVAATANGLMLMGQSLNQFGRRDKRTPCLASTTTTLVPARDSGWPLLHRP